MYPETQRADKSCQRPADIQGSPHHREGLVERWVAISGPPTPSSQTEQLRFNGLCPWALYDISLAHRVHSQQNLGNHWLPRKGPAGAGASHWSPPTPLLFASPRTPLCQDTQNQSVPRPWIDLTKFIGNDALTGRSVYLLRLRGLLFRDQNPSCQLGEHPLLPSQLFPV